MKFRQICIALVIMFVTATASGQSSSLLVCRGGGNLKLEYRNSLMIIKFKKGSQGVDKNWKGISAGECSFQDRTVDASEPDKVKWQINDFSISWAINEEIIRPKQINFLMNPNKYQSFHVKDDGRGSFKVVDIGESR